MPDDSEELDVFAPDEELSELDELAEELSAGEEPESDDVPATLALPEPLADERLSVL